MKNKHFVLLLLPFIMMDVSAQKTKEEKFQVSYVRLPYKRLPEDIKTYQVNVTALHSRWGNVLLREGEASNFILNGYAPVKENGDLVIEVKVLKELEFKRLKSEVKEYTHKEKKDAPEKKYYPHIYYVYYNTPEISIRLLHKGRQLESAKFGGEEKYSSFGSDNYKDHYISTEQLNAAWNKLGNSFLSDYELHSFKTTPSEARGVLVKYLLTHQTKRTDIEYVISHKDHNYDDLAKAKDLFASAVKYISSDRISYINTLVQPDYEKRQETLREAIAIWEKALSEYKDEKNARINGKIYRDILMNLAETYVWTGDTEKAKEYLAKRKQEKSGIFGNAFDGLKRIEDHISSVEERSAANNWRKLHTSDPQFEENQYSKEFVYNYDLPGLPAQQPSAAAAANTASAQDIQGLQIGFAPATTPVSNTTGNVRYTADAKARLEEKIDIEETLDLLTARINVAANALNRFSIYDSAQLFKESAVGTNSEKLNVLLLPFSFETNTNNKIKHATLLEKAKQKGIRKVVFCHLDMVDAKPVKAQGSQDTQINYAGFEGEIRYTVEILDMESGQSNKISKTKNKGLLKKANIKAIAGGAVGLLGLTKGKSAGESTLDGAVGSAYGGSLADQGMARTKMAAITEIVNKVEKDLKDILGEHFPVYLQLSFNEVGSEHSIYIDAKESRGIARHDQIDIVIRDAGKETSETKIETLTVKEVSDGKIYFKVSSKEFKKITSVPDKNLVFGKLSVPKSAMIQIN
ncbi:MAG: hypothetical protein KF862_08075 [Chitinophagaceae bacterium]|nr:hypothetical protein [Chitinophagaceae bacterium]